MFGFKLRYFWYVTEWIRDASHIFARQLVNKVYTKVQQTSCGSQCSFCSLTCSITKIVTFFPGELLFRLCFRRRHRLLSCSRLSPRRGSQSRFSLSGLSSLDILCLPLICHLSLKLFRELHFTGIDPIHLCRIVFHNLVT